MTYMLADDVARCNGVIDFEGCKNCLRRTPVNGDRVVMMGTPSFFSECEFLIEAEDECEDGSI